MATGIHQDKVDSVKIYPEKSNIGYPGNETAPHAIESGMRGCRIFSLYQSFIATA